MPAPIRAITFDVYGTLVDWEGGVRSWAQRMLARKQAQDRITPGEFFKLWEQHQFALLRPYRGYRDLAARAVERVLRDLKLPVEPEDGPSLGDEIASWRAFPDVPDGLKRLSGRYKL